MKTSNDTAKVLGALVIGAATGAALGVLFAPRKGTKTREKLMERKSKFVKSAEKATKHEAKSLKKKAHKLEKAVQYKLDKIKNNVIHKAADQITAKELDAAK